MDGAVRLRVYQTNEWFENYHMLSPLHDAQHTGKDATRASVQQSVSNLAAAADPTPAPADGTILLFARNDWIVRLI